MTKAITPVIAEVAAPDKQLELITAEQIAQDEKHLGGYAYQIIAQQSKRIAKLRSQVLADTDIEALHQMRVSTRKLRAAIALFSDILIMPDKKPHGKNKKTDQKLNKKTSLAKLTKSIKAFAETLGSVRDLDVMQQWFEQVLVAHSDSGTKKAKEESKTTQYFSKKERETIQALLKQIEKQRTEKFSDLKATLKGDAYKKLIHQFKQWVKQPAFTAAAQQSAEQGAAYKLIAPIATLIAHPGWLFATRSQGTQSLALTHLTLPKLNQQLAKNGEQLHDLRKQIKRVRYQAEFFRGLYDITYAAQIREFRDMQNILGELQDQAVIGQFLTQALGDDWAKQLPTLDAAFQNSRLALWQQWQPYQRKYLKLRTPLSIAS